MLLLKTNPELKIVFQKLIKTVKAPVTWKDIFAIKNNKLILLGEVRSLIFDFDDQTVRNFCSWLLNFKPYELPILSYAIAIVLSESFTIQERTVIGSIFSTIATNTFLIAAQQGFMIQVESAKVQQEVKYNNEDRGTPQKQGGQSND